MNCLLEGSISSQSEPPSAEANIAELECFCGQLALENALLKKALGTLPMNSGMSSLNRHVRRSSPCPFVISANHAKAESFFKTLKQEEIYLNQYQTFEEASTNIGQFIEDVYNTKRLHSSLGYVPPIEFEWAYFQDVRC